MDPRIDVLSHLNEHEFLPTLPTVAAEVIDLAAQQDASVVEVSELIGKDIALSVRLLQVANSSLYGFSRDIESLTDAVGLLGFKQVSNLALGISVASSLPKTEIYGFSFEEFWRNSVSNAVSAVLTASRVRDFRHPGVFTASLLQDIGTCVLVSLLPLVYGAAAGAARWRGIHPVHAEREVLGTDHAEVGAMLAEKWNLPAVYRNVIRHHHFTESGDVPKLNGETDLVKVVSLSSMFTDVLFAEDGAEREPGLRMRAAELLDISQRDVDEILEKIPEEIAGVQSLFEIGGQGDSEAEEDVFLDNCPRCGSTSDVRFCADCGASLSQHAGLPEEMPSLKVLVAEDSEAIRSALVSLLQKRGYQAIVALDGQEAYNLTGKERPDLVLMDIRMPLLDGIQALRKIRQDVRISEIPVVMLTSVTDFAVVSEAIEAGANGYVAKPFTIEKLLKTVQKHAEKAVEIAED